MSDLQSRYDAAVAILNEHNRVMLDTGNVAILNEHNRVMLDTGNPDKTYAPNEYPDGWIDPDVFLRNLKIVGGTSLERLQKLTVEDVLGCLQVNGTSHMPRPMPLAKDIVKALRADKQARIGKRTTSRSSVARRPKR